jgi:ATP adenylyltransferase
MPSDPQKPEPAAQQPTHPAAIQAPWRQEYLETIDEQEKAGGAGKSAGAGGAAGAPASTGSFLRDYWLAPGDDAKNHVVVRAKHGMILLNKFPYAGGHLLVALGEARPTLLDYDADQRAALWRLVDAASDLVSDALAPQGVNIGINQGRAAGAGVPGHLHVHLVPRWGGDVNFMSVVGQVRVIPVSLEKMAERYRVAWGRVSARWGTLLEAGESSKAANQQISK